MTENWKPYPTNAKYMVSNTGRVKGPRGILKPSIRKWGHRAVSVDYKTVYIHRMVLETFVGECPAGMEGCHVNGDASDNRVENLRWDSHSNNELDKVEHGTSLRGSHYAAKITKEDAREIRRRYEMENIGQKALGKEYGINQQTISKIVNYKLWGWV